MSRGETKTAGGRGSRLVGRGPFAGKGTRMGKMPVFFISAGLVALALTGCKGSGCSACNSGKWNPPHASSGAAPTQNVNYANTPTSPTGGTRPAATNWDGRSQPQGQTGAPVSRTNAQTSGGVTQANYADGS